MPIQPDVSSLTLNRLSVYLRCLRVLSEEGATRISSKDLARRFNLSAPQIRKDLAQFGEFGIRGVGYDIAVLERRLVTLLGLDRPRRLIVVGVGNLGRALARHLTFNQNNYQVVAAVDTDPGKFGMRVGELTVRPVQELAEVVRETGAEIGIMAVPAWAAQRTYTELVSAGIGAVLNFAPVTLEVDPEVPVKNVDMRIHLEELGFLLNSR